MTDQLTLALAPPAGNPPPAGVPSEVVDIFEGLALSVAKAGFTHYSADEILHQVRWHHRVEKGRRDFKCNNNWTAPLARWFLKKHPELPKFFELREKRPVEVPKAYDEQD